MPGRWKTDVVEVARGPMLALTRPGIKKITIMGPTQMLKTEFLNNVVGYFMHQDPSPIVVMQPIEKLAKTWSVTRLDPMLRDTPVLRDLVKNKRDRDSGNTEFLKMFTGGFVAIVSAGSPSDVASRPARIALIDELDKNPSSGDEGDAEKLIEQRLETFWNSISIAVCSPTNEGTSKIAARFADSDQAHFHGRCPYCNQFEKLEWSQVKWNDGDPETARYQCSKCENEWTELDRRKAVNAGDYIATMPFKGHAGFHCNAIASPWQPLSNMVRKFLEAGKDPEKLKVFINTSLAETWKPAVEKPDWERLYDRREHYPLGKIPAASIKFLTCGIDVQGNRIEAMVVGWTRDKQAFVVDYQVFSGETNRDEVWNECEEFLRNTTYDGFGRRFRITLSSVDSGSFTAKVYEFVSRFAPNQVRATKGQDKLRTAYKMGSAIETQLDGTKFKFAHHVWNIGSSYLKELVYGLFKLPSPVEGVAVAGYIHTPDLDVEFYKQLCSESLKRTKKGWAWEKDRERNEALDTFVMARGGAAMFGIDRFSAEEWDIVDEVVSEPIEDGVDMSSPQPIVQETEPAPPEPRPEPKKSVSRSPLWRNGGLRRRA